MGTNYYTKINICPTCKRAEEEVHLGKSSFGWKFLFQYNGGKFYKNVHEMKKWLSNKVIKNEYGEIVPCNEFWKMVKEKQKTTDPEEIKEYLIIDGYKFFDREFS